MNWLEILFYFLRGLVTGRTDMAAENITLRQHLAVLQRETRRPSLQWRDRFC